jgi:hypothetical protein
MPKSPTVSPILQLASSGIERKNKVVFLIGTSPACSRENTELPRCCLQRLLRSDTMGERKHAACFARRVKFVPQKYLPFRKTEIVI